MLLWLGITNYKANVNTVSYFCQGANWKFYMMLFSWTVIEIIDKISHSVRFFCSIMRLCMANPVCYTDFTVRRDGRVSQIAV